jgi:TRAP-type C4-dicarboxylate transport system substrate-binding protein
MMFQGLSEDEQTAILDAGQAATKASAQFLRDQEAAIKEELISKGMQIDDPADGEQEFIELATTKVWPQFTDSIGGVEKLNAALTAIGRDPVDF